MKLEQAEEKLMAMQKKFALREAELSTIRKEVSKMVKANNYETHYPIPKCLHDHRKKYPKACYIQILGCRRGSEILD